MRIIQNIFLFTFIQISTQTTSQIEDVIFCPNGVTLADFEPKCENYKINDWNSGVCSHQKGTICRRGHCCPSFRISKFYGLMLGETYVTNETCNVNLLKRYWRGYCNDTISKIVILGKYKDRSLYSDTKKACTHNSNCTKSQICLFTNGIGECVRIKEPTLKPDRKHETYVLMANIGFYGFLASILLLLLSGIVWCQLDYISYREELKMLKAKRIELLQAQEQEISDSDDSWLAWSEDENNFDPPF